MRQRQKTVSAFAFLLALFLCGCSIGKRPETALEVPAGIVDTQPESQTGTEDTEEDAPIDTALNIEQEAEDAEDANAEAETDALPEPEPEPEPEALPLTGHLICIDPGHCVTPLTGKGYTDPVSPLSDERKPVYTTGTQGKTLSEEELNLIVGLKLRDKLEELGAEIIMTREVSEITITGVERCEIANQANADVAIRIHADGNNDRSVHGVSVLVPSGDLLGTPSIKDESVRLGRLMVDAVAEKTGAKNRGIINRSDMTGFNFSEVPSVLIEMGFMTNAEEDALLSTEEYQDKTVDGMVESILEWYGAEGDSAYPE